jgi:glucose/arabinose dehydrogenase
VFDSTTSVPTTSLPPATTSTTVATTFPATTTTTIAPLLGLDLVTVADGLVQPTLLLSPPNDDRRFVGERTGVISVLNDDASLSPFLDLRDRVNSGGIEQGLLGMAFHPDFAANGRFFVYYYRLGAEQTRLSEFIVDASGIGDPSSERDLLTFDKPTTRHNGGMLLFGPDGYLWMSLGEGGKASVNSQDPFRLLSSILRIDVDRGDPYGIPADNPYADGVEGAPEVWAKGLRNPWRFTIDSDLLYLADVGHEDLEEINVVSLDGAPYNFGWLRMEGSQCFQSGCDPVAEGLTLPVAEYTHAEGCSITGGAVYRGNSIPEIAGHYFYADWCGQWVRSFRYSGGELLDHQTRFEDAGQINSFGVDSLGELYLLTYEGQIKQVVGRR